MTEYKWRFHCDGNAIVLSDDEVNILWQLIVFAIEDGSYPNKMRQYMNLFDKFDKIVKRKRGK